MWGTRQGELQSDRVRQSCLTAVVELQTLLHRRNGTEHRQSKKKRGELMAPSTYSLKQRSEQNGKMISKKEMKQGVKQRVQKKTG